MGSEICTKRSQSDKALEFYQQALSIYREVGDRGGEARTLTHIAFIVKEVSIAEAISLMKQVVNISEEIHDPMLEDYRNILENFQQLFWA